MKQAIKDIIQAGGTVSFPMKHSVDAWFGNIKVSPIKLPWGEAYYYVEPFGKNFDNIDDAVNLFINEAFSSKNVGYIQMRLAEKGIDFEDEFDLENPTENLLQLFEEEGKLVDEEFKNKFGDV